MKGWLKSAFLGLFTAAVLVYAGLMMSVSKPFELELSVSKFLTVLVVGSCAGLALGLVLHWLALRRVRS